MISYAQNFEDVILNRVFKDQPTGFYIDVGAADPINLSVTKWFYDNGWSGINVEPVREFYDMLARDRPRDVNLNCGAGATSGEMRFHEYPVKEWSTFDLNARPSEKAAGLGIREVVVPIRTLNEIIEQNASGRSIDFLKIDVEGWEEQVLRGIDLRTHRPTVILLETIDRDTQEQVSAAVETILNDADYLSVYFDGINNFYLKRERAELTKRLSTPPNLFDDFKFHREVEQAKVNEMQQAEIRKQQAWMNQAQIDLPARMQQIETLTSMFKNLEGEHQALEKQARALSAEIQALQARISANDEFIWIAESRISRLLRPIIRFLQKAAGHQSNG